MAALKNYFWIAIFSFFALPVGAQINCTDFNTHKFFETLNYDLNLLEKCSSLSNGRKNFIKDENGLIPFFKALTSEIGEDVIDDFYYSLDEENFEKLFLITDNDGRNAFDIAIDDAPYITYLVRLLSYFDPPNGLTEIVNLLALSELNSDYISILKLNGAMASEPISLEYSDQLALLSPKTWSDVTFSNFKIRELKLMPEEWRINDRDCPEFFEVDFLKTLDASQFLACKKADINEYFDENGSSFLHLIAEHTTDPTVFDLYLGGLSKERRDEVLHAKDQDNLRAIHIAAKYSENPSILSRLVGWGANIDAPVKGNGKLSLSGLMHQKWKTRPIHLVSARTDDVSYRMLIRILAHGADPYAQNEIGNTALHILLLNEGLENFFLEVLLQSQMEQLLFQSLRKKVSEPKNEAGATPLAFAVSKKIGSLGEPDDATNIQHHWIINELLLFGANPDKEDKDDWTPLLLYAASGRDADTFQLLLDFSKKPCKAKSKGGINIVSALKQNTHLKNGRTSGSEVVNSPMGLFKKRCPK